MNRQINILTLAALLFVGAGCKALQEGQDAFVVRSEQIQQAAFDVVDTFLAFELSNRDALWQIDPGIKHAADELRVTYPPANESVIAMIGAYKRNRTLDNKANVLTALAVVSAAKDQAQIWLTRTGGEQ